MIFVVKLVGYWKYVAIVELGQHGDIFFLMYCCFVTFVLVVLLLCCWIYRRKFELNSIHNSSVIQSNIQQLRFQNPCEICPKYIWEEIWDEILICDVALSDTTVSVWNSYEIIFSSKLRGKCVRISSLMRPKFHPKMAFF